VPFTVALGPNTVVAIEASAAGTKRLQDLYVGSIYNSPDPSQMALLRNDGAEFPKLAEAALPRPATRGNRVTLKAGQPEAACFLINEGKSDIFRAENLSSGKPVPLLTVSNLPAGSDYASGSFRHTPLPEFVFYKPGAANLLLRPVEESAAGKFQFGKENNFDLGQPIRRVITLDEPAGQKLLVIFGEGEKAGVFEFDGVKAPVLKQTIVSPMKC